MPKKQTPRPDNAYNSPLTIILELVAELVFAQERDGVKDDHQFVFHEVYERCTHHISLPTQRDASPMTMDCVCWEVSAEAVLKHCQRLGLLPCIPFICGTAWQRVALAEYLKVKAVVNRPLVRSIPPQTRGRPQVKPAVQGVRSEHVGIEYYTT